MKSLNVLRHYRFCDDVRTFLKEYKRFESKDDTVTL